MARWFLFSVALVVLSVFILFRWTIGGWGVPVLCGVAGGLFWLNALRLLLAGGRFPLHLDPEGIADWHPATVGSIAVLAMGVLVAQPLFGALVGLALSGSSGAEPSLLAGVEWVGAHWPITVPASLAFSLLFGAGALVRLGIVETWRVYEYIAHDRDRALVTLERDQTDDVVDRLLVEAGFHRHGPRRAGAFGRPRLVAGRSEGVVVYDGWERLVGELTP